MRSSLHIYGNHWKGILAPHFIIQAFKHKMHCFDLRNEAPVLMEETYWMAEDKVLFELYLLTIVLRFITYIVLYTRALGTVKFI